jgi:hypothetical protein
LQCEPKLPSSLKARTSSLRELSSLWFAFPNHRKGGGGVRSQIRRQQIYCFSHSIFPLRVVVTREFMAPTLSLWSLIIIASSQKAFFPYSNIHNKNGGKNGVELILSTTSRRVSISADTCVTQNSYCCKIFVRNFRKYVPYCTMIASCKSCSMFLR